MKALGLLSGGLDSTLALRLIHDQGIEVTALNFHTGFCFSDIRRATRRPIPQAEGNISRETGGPSDALSAAAKLGIPIEVIDISKGYLEVLHHPQYGYGKNVNPCVDCRIHMFKRARELMEEIGAGFIFTGEVLGQRPKSQHLSALHLIANEAGLRERLLRPLSALLLPPTLPEREGWVDRAKLMGFHGRTRKPQMALAAELGIAGYPQPAGGCCFLTDPQYGRKVRDMWEHSVKDEMEWEDYLLLKVGRHVRIAQTAKVVVGRDEGENLFLEQFQGDRIRLEVEDFPSPVALFIGEASDDLLLRAARVVGRYSDGRDKGVELSVTLQNGKSESKLLVMPYSPEEVQGWVIS